MNIIFLGYDEAQTSLISFLESRGHAIFQTSDEIKCLRDFDFAISFGYRHVISQSVLDTARRPPINLHIAYLPFNRGMHPNFWSWMERTPSGVTIHEIDAGLDTGPIIYQKKITTLADDMTFSETYKILITMVEALFKDNFLSILDNSYRTRRQSEKGTSHRSTELPDWLTSWDMKISDAQEIYNTRPKIG